jgi:hypothetical protein|tara:strand:- start:189 stop:698 length:510 start_codon:yes stop_codon:yes gene_type:complete
MNLKSGMTKQKYKLYDNHLSEKDMIWLEDLLLSENFPYYYQSNITENDNEFMFAHTLITGSYSNSDYAETIVSKLMEKIPHEQIIRAKVNFYPKTNEIVKHNYHTDRDNYPVKAALFYVNSNDGYTEFENDDIISSNRNRMLLFNGSERHRSTTCTNANARVNININYK